MRYLMPHEDPGGARFVLAVLVVVLLIATILTLANIARILVKDPNGGDMNDIRDRLEQIQCDIQGMSARYAERVTVTCYNSVVEQTDSTPHTTAINTRVRPGTVAVSRDLLERGWAFGSKVWIEGLGVYVIEDVMHPRKSRQIDIWQPEHAPVFKHDQVLAVVIR